MTMVMIGHSPNDDRAAAETADFCLVRETPHHPAGPQELTHPDRGGCKGRGEEPSRLSRPKAHLLKVGRSLLLPGATPFGQ